MWALPIPQKDAFRRESGATTGGADAARGHCREEGRGPLTARWAGSVAPRASLSGGGRGSAHGGLWSQLHPKATSPSRAATPPPPALRLASPAASAETPAGSQAGGPAPQAPGGFGRQHGCSSSIFSAGNTSPVVPPGRGIPTLCHGKQAHMGTWGPLQGLVGVGPRGTPLPLSSPQALRPAAAPP